MVQVRAKLFALVKDEGWKERGIGSLRLNVAKNSFETDEVTGETVAVGESKERSARLIMRQEATHRVLLNSPILKAVKFHDEKAANGIHKISFIAVEDNKPANLLFKASLILWFILNLCLPVNRCLTRVPSFSWIKCKISKTGSRAQTSTFHGQTLLRP